VSGAVTVLSCGALAIHLVVVSSPASTGRLCRARDAGGRGGRGVGTLLGPEGTGARLGGGFSRAGRFPFLAGRGWRGAFLENCTVDASIYPGSPRVAGGSSA